MYRTAAMTLMSLVFFVSHAEARRGKDPLNEHVMEQLNLTSDQKTKLEEIKKKDRGQMKALRAKRREAGKKMRAAFEGNASQDELRKAHQEFQGARNELGNAQFEKILAIREVLNPEQRKKFHELKGEKMRTRWKEKFLERGGDKEKGWDEDEE